MGTKQSNTSKLKINSMLKVGEYEKGVFMPNEIFADLKCIEGSSHIAFAYCYYYLSLWLYRYAKYGSINIDVKLIKKTLGLYENNKTINYLIKKSGVLDEIGYTMSTTDYPVAYELSDQLLEFHLLSELSDEDRNMMMTQRGKNYKIKLPIKGLHRIVDSYIDNCYDGVFYDVGNTHQVSWDIFARSMEDSQFGCTGFYIYSYLKWKCDMHTEGYDVSVHKLSSELGISIKTLSRYLNTLRQYNWIRCDVQDYVIGLDEDKRKSNRYYVNEMKQFSHVPIKFTKRNVIKLDEYEKMEQERNRYMGENVPYIFQ